MGAQRNGWRSEATIRPVRRLALVWLLMLAACGRPAAGATAGVPAVVPAPAESTSTAIPAAGTRVVVLAIRRDRALHILDATTLEDLAQVRLHNPAHRVSASPDGRMLFIAQGATPEGAGCCALFALDLATTSMCRLVEPASEAVPSPDGRYIFTQRGNDGIQVFDGQTLKRLPAIAVPGVYELHPSPDGRRLFGTNYWPELSLDMVDVERGTFERRLVLPVGNTVDHSGVALDGTWLGEQFRLVHLGRSSSTVIR